MNSSEIGCNCIWTICQCQTNLPAISADLATCEPCFGEYDKADTLRDDARESFRAFVNPKPSKGVDHYSHPAGRRR